MDKDIGMALGGIFVFLVLILGAASWEIYQDSECRKLAIEHNMNYLEIKDLCKHE